MSWIDTAGGILLEKAIPVRLERSLQVDINPGGRITPLALTRMLSRRDRSYGGNLIDAGEQRLLSPLADSLMPVLEAVAKMGYVGPLGLDLIETETGQIKAVEINCRLTMGRVALGWHALPPFPAVSLFVNHFQRHDRPPAPEAVSNLCRKLEKHFGCTITLINRIITPNGRRSLQTICLQGNQQTAVWDAWQAYCLQIGAVDRQTI